MQPKMPPPPRRYDGVLEPEHIAEDLEQERFFATHRERERCAAFVKRAQNILGNDPDLSGVTALLRDLLEAIENPPKE